jgi:PBP1b-binding outer membrane lipoprotein LpoB
MKKTLSIILSVLLILFFVGCTKPTQSSQAPQEALNPQEVAQQTVFAVNAF